VTLLTAAAPAEVRINSIVVPPLLLAAIV